MEKEKEKPPIIGEQEQLTCSLVDNKHTYKELEPVIKEACIHQRDADVEWYRDKIRKQDFIWQQQIEQARQETANELMQTIETMYPELRQVYWEGKDWQSLKSKFLKPKEGDSKTEQPDS